MRALVTSAKPRPASTRTFPIRVSLGALHQIPRRAGPGPHLALVCAAFRSGTHLSLSQAEHGMDDAEGTPPRAGRPVDVAGCGSFRPTQVGAQVRCGSAAAVGAPLRCGASYADAGPSRRFGAFGAPGHARQAAETLR